MKINNMKINRLIYFIPLLLIGCKKAPKDYYTPNEVEVIEPIKYTTNIDDSTDIYIAIQNGCDPAVAKFLHELNVKRPLRHMINPEEAAPHIVKVRIIE